jgi:threonine dehydrogenase-like Zn-dependent dehydrogenase
MKALWLQDLQAAYLQDVPIPQPGPDEALVRVRLAGICSTDLEMVRGYYPYTGVMGHEFVGEVTTAPDAQAWVGRRVAGEINIGCGVCPACRRGRKSHCERRQVIGLRGHDGVFAEYLALPTANLHAVPDSVADEAAVFTEPLAAALEIQEQVPVGPGQRVLVIGAGRLGLLVARTLAAAGCELAVLARSPRPQAILAEWGIRVVSAQEVAAESLDLVVEVSGSPQGFEIAARAVRPEGTIVLKSTYAGPAAVDLSRLVVNEVRVVGSRCGPFAAALRELASGWVNPRPLIEAVYPLENGLEALAHAARPGALKVLLRP